MIKRMLTGTLLLMMVTKMNAQNSFPNGFSANKGNNFGGSALLTGSQFSSHFQFSDAEDTYIRGGKPASRVIIGDLGASAISIGSPSVTTTVQGLVEAKNGFTALRGSNPAGAALLRGTKWDSHFFFSDAEDTYLRGGKDASNVYIGDVNTQGVVIVGSVPSTPAGYKLYVDRGILTERVKVAIKTTANWSDYIFDKNYQLPSLQSVEQFVNTNKHLPGIPSAETVVKEGIDLGEMNSKLLGKIEELTLYLIEMEKEIKALKQEAAAKKGTTINN
jgi:trimeric autotransporter adhesin